MTQEQFDKQMEMWRNMYTDPNERCIARGAIARTARLCTEHPDLAKVWYDKLPKVTMD